MTKMRIEFEPVKASGDDRLLRGWVLSDENVTIKLYSLANKKHPKSIKFNFEERTDIKWVIPEAKDLVPGFNVTFHKKDLARLLPIEVRVRTDSGDIQTFTYKRFAYYKRQIMDSSGHAGEFLRTLRSIYHILTGKAVFSPVDDNSHGAQYGHQSTKAYHSFLKDNDPSAKELLRQKSVYKKCISSGKKLPVFHFVTAVYDTKPLYLKELISSLKSQTFGNWEICFAECSVDSNGKILRNGRILRSIISNESKKDDRIHLLNSDSNYGIADNTNLAIRYFLDRLPDKDGNAHFIAFIDHDDMLAPDAVYENTRAFLSNKNISFIYSDEDKINKRLGRFAPNFKPDFSPDYLYSVNYICHLVCASAALVRQVGLLNNEYDGAQDYDFVLRATGALCREESRIYHIPKVLYHWRSHSGSTALDPAKKDYAFRAGARAIESWLMRCGIKARALPSKNPGFYSIDYHSDTSPLISILIPNKDHTDDLDICLRSIKKQTYTNYEVIIIENNSTDSSTFEYYKKLDDERIRVITFETDSFNYSSINNFGAAHARGEYLLLLNNDTEMIKEDVLRQMLGVAARADVGAVGALLLYSDDTIQHAGVVIGYGGIAGHAFVRLNSSWPGYMGRIMCSGNYSAVTAACMLVRKSVFDEVGGFYEELGVAFNDVDLCLKIRQKGYHIVYRPQAVLYHYESKSRGYEDNIDKIKRFEREIKIMHERWSDIFEKGDPYYNPNLTLQKADFSLYLKPKQNKKDVKNEN